MAIKKIRNTKAKKLFDALNKLKVGQAVKKKELMLLHWGIDDFYTQRSFDVILHGAKKKFNGSKTFDTRHDKEIKRLS